MTLIQALGILSAANLHQTRIYRKFGNGSTFPQVVADENVIGGCQETVKYLREQKLI